LNSVQDRGILFLGPNEPVYTGMVIGENTRELDMDVNPCKKKHVTNMRSSSSDEAVRLTPPKIFSLEQALEWINDDELVEVTPNNIRMRKTILDRSARAKAAKNNK
jgi:GTP-binding protein